MNNRAADAPLVTFSCTVYRLFMTAYPARFRREYGVDMLQVFRDACRRTIRESGTKGLTRFWALTLFDLVRSVPEQHLQKEAYMSRSQFIKVSGIALILSSLPYV